MSKTINTSSVNWLEDALKEYSSKNEFTLIDDKKIKIRERDLKSAVNLIKASKAKGGKSTKQITKALVSLGLSSAGIYVIILAIADPEPTTKLSLLLVGGIILAISGGYGTLRALRIKFRVKKKSETDGIFHVKPMANY